ncbi:MAG: DUF4339 domain-containing protein [Verrucomicrobiota bacterium]|nr:DUF4339 domain-containing protein [Verrucomicrobiota bacterium]MDE3066049.1 DUF4339 domain-containing protein [Verrucomicrobiota bacterium]
MASYFIIGGDGKQYGPVTADELRKWVAEGRLNAQSQAKGEGDAEWRPLSAVPELADVFAPSLPSPGAPPPFAPAGDGARQAALQKVKTPAVGLKVTAIINLLLSAWSLVRLMFFHPDLRQFNSELQALNNPQLEQFMQKIMHLAYGPLGVANALLGAGMAVLIFIGAAKMQSLRSHEFAFTAAVLSVIPCLTPCCGYVIGLIFGIWALVVLAKPEVKSQFT